MNKKLSFLIVWLLLAALCCSACSQASPAASDVPSTTPHPSGTAPTSSTDPSVTDTTPAETTAPLPQTLEEIEAWVDEYHVQNENRLTRTHTIPCGDYVFIISDRYTFTDWPVERIPMENIRQIERYCISTGEMLDFGWLEMSHCSFSTLDDGSCNLVGLVLNDEWILSHQADGSFAVWTKPHWPVERIPMENIRQIERYCISTGEMLDFGWLEMSHCSFSTLDDGSCNLVGLVLNDEWILSHQADGSFAVWTKPHQMVVEELPAVAENQQPDELPAPTVIIGQQVTFDGVSILLDYRYAEHRGIGLQSPGAYALTSFNAETREMTIELPLTVPGDSLEVSGSNQYIESARIEARGEDGSAILLKLSENARYCLKQGNYIDSPDRYDEGQIAYYAITWTFDCTGEWTDDAEDWTSPNDYPGDVILF